MNDGLIIEFVRSEAKEPHFRQYRFWKLFGSLRPEWGNFWWCQRFQPWMGAPKGYMDEDFVQAGGFELWRPHLLDRYGDHMGEEWMHLWAVDLKHGDPVKTVERYAKDHDQDEFERKFAKVILDYIDESCWYVFASEDRSLQTLRAEPNAGTVVQPQSLSLRLSLGNLQAFLSPQALDPLVIDLPASPSEQRRHPAIAVAAILGGQ
jgi:hypothetical protein